MDNIVCVCIPCIYLFLWITPFLVFQELWKTTKILKSDILKKETKKPSNVVCLIRRQAYLKLDLLLI